MIDYPIERQLEFVCLERDALEAKVAALTAEQARRLCAEGHEQHRLWSVCYVCQLQDAVDTEQARVAALTAELEERDELLVSNNSREQARVAELTAELADAHGIAQALEHRYIEQQARVAALTAALARVREWTDHAPHQVSELRAFLDALDTAGGTNG